jgi:hypothetical protein
VRAGRVRVLRERLPELRAETLLVFLFASKECEECASSGQPPGFGGKENDRGDPQGPTDETRVDGRTSDPRRRRVKTHVRAR